MKIFGIKLQEGTSITNLTVASGTDFPDNPNEGELFYRSDEERTLKGLYLYVNGSWDRVASTESLSCPSGSTLPELALEGELFFLKQDIASEELIIEGLHVFKNAQWVNISAGGGGGGGSGTVTSVNVAQPAAGLSITGAPITTSGTLTFALANDLLAVESLSTTGFAVRTGNDAWAIRELSVTGSGLSVSNSTGQSGNPQISSNATSQNTASTIVFRDASGNFSAGTVSATFSGDGSAITNLNASNLATGTVNDARLSANVALLDTAQTFTAAKTFRAANAVRAEAAATQDAVVLAGRAGGTGSFGVTLTPTTLTANRTLTLPDSAGTVALTSQLPTVNDGTLTLAVSGVGLSGSASFTANQSGASTFTVTSNATSSNTVSTIVSRDASGNFSAGTITGSLTGAASLNVLKSGDTMTGALTLSGDPTSNLHAATKSYVDNLAQGVIARPAVRAATTGNLTATYNNGTAGVGATLTGTGALPTIDGVTLAAGNGVLVRAQTTAAQNGRYVVTTLSPNWVLTRCGLCDEASEIPGSYVFVNEGTLYAATGWVQTVSNAGTFTVGTDAITVTQFSAAGAYTGGTGISVSGTTISLGTGNALSLHNLSTNGLVARTAANTVTARTLTGPAAGITVSNGDGVSGNPTLALADDLAAVEGLSTTGIIRRTGANTWTAGGAISLTTEVTGTLPIANGGTGATTADAALTNLGATTVGANFFKLANPSAITFPRINANNTVSAVSASDFRTDLAVAGLNVANTFTQTNTFTVGQFADGTATAPSITFTNDTDTGFYRVGGNILGITTGGSQAVTIDGAGNVNVSGRLGVLSASSNNLVVANLAGTYNANAGTTLGINNSVTIDNTASLTANRTTIGAYSLVESSLQNNQSFTHQAEGARSIASAGASAGNSIDGFGTVIGTNTQAIFGSGNATFNRMNLMYGAFNQAYVTGTQAIGANVHGSFNLVQASNAGSTISTAYGVRSRITSSDASSSITTGYLFFGDTTGSGTFTNRYGLFINSTINNYVAGGFQVAGTAATGTGTAGLGVGVAPSGTAGTIRTSGQILSYAADTASAPGYSWDGDTNCGMFRPAADTVAFTTDGTERFRILANGGWSVGSNGTSTGTAGQVLTSNGSGAAPTWANITTVGTIGAGTWQGDIINSTYGGTGINNGGRTLTISGQSFTLSGSLGARSITTASNIVVSGATTNGRTLTFATGDADRTVTLANNFTTAGNFPLTLTTTGSTNVTLPTSGTLATTAQLPTVNNGQLTVAASGTGLSVSASPTFTANQSGNTTITLTINSTTSFGSGQGNTVVLRDSNGHLVESATIDGGIRVGFRSIPRTTSTTLAATSVGRCHAVSSGVTVPANTFAAGDAVTIYNDSASNITITQGSSLTLRFAGTTSTGNRTLAPRGIATMWFNSATEAIISGSGLS